VHGAPEKPLRLVPCEPGSPARDAAELYVKDAFRRRHNAEVRSFMPQLLLLQDSTGSVHGVVGIRQAAGEKLYRERYLDAPVEQIVSRRTGLLVRREHVVEVGNLACKDNTSARALLLLLPWYLLRDGSRWVAFTGTTSVRDLVRRLGASLIELASAEAARVADTDDAWGAYYQHDPRVVVGFLPQVKRLAAFRNALRRS